MDMCVCENQNKTENSETEKSSNNNPLPQNTTDTQIVPHLSLMYYCWKSVTMFGCDVVESRMFQLVQFTKINYKKKTKSKKCKCKQYNVVAV